MVHDKPPAVNGTSPMPDAVTYLLSLLAKHELAKDSPEINELRRRRDEVEAILRKRYGSLPVIRYAGSFIKGTMVIVAYDLDIICYFVPDDTSAGTTIKEIYEDIERTLAEHYTTDRKGPAIRLLDLGSKHIVHIDVVPGRFVDGNSGPAFLYPTGTGKEWMKTDLDVHIKHVAESGVRDAIKLMKIWAVARHVKQSVRTFALELLVIDLLADMKDASLDAQLQQVLTAFRDRSGELSISDPANSNNDLSALLGPQTRAVLAAAARESLEALSAGSWKDVFDPSTTSSDPAARLARLVGTAVVRPQPYSCDHDLA